MSSIKNSHTKYVLEGDGAGTLFKVDDRTGDVFVYDRLDREKKAEYLLKALILDQRTNKPLESPSVFSIAVYDINDNAPIFVHRVFNGSVLEMSPVGRSLFVSFFSSSGFLACQHDKGCNSYQFRMAQLTYLPVPRWHREAGACLLRA